jgi:proline iminopeptidase
MRRDRWTSATAIASIGSVAARAAPSRRSSCTAAPAQAAAPTIAASSTRSVTTCCCSTSEACGVERPHASLEANTTWHLVADIERLREMLGVDRWMVFGGSWGSTLALAYAQAHPHRASELVLRGIFTFRQTELDWLYRYGASEIFPDKWQEFLAPIPEAERTDLVAAYHRRLTGDDPAARLAAAKAWSKWEAETVTLLPNPEVIEEHCSDDFAIAIARIENHYMINKGWIEEGALIRNAGLLHGIKGVIVQGRYDCCTPPAAAWDLKQAWPQVELEIVPDGGHLFNEPGILDGLIRATDAFAAR